MKDLKEIPIWFEAVNHSNDHHRSVDFKPYGFWSNNIHITQRKDFVANTWQAPELSWASGGRDREVESDLIATHHFIGALKEAQKKYVEWDKDTGKE